MNLARSKRNKTFSKLILLRYSKKTTPFRRKGIHLQSPFSHLTGLRLLELAPMLMHWLLGVIGPFPRPLWIRDLCY